ncbi:hypothetical protein HK096_009137, partial [Nowakowskiella sp. JEL0078]
MILESLKPWLIHSFELTLEELTKFIEGITVELLQNKTYNRGISVVGRKKEISVVTEADVISPTPSLDAKIKGTEIQSTSSNGTTDTQNISKKSKSSPEGTNETGNSVKLNEKIAANWKPELLHSTRNDAKLDHKRRYHAIEDSPYALPADLEEQERLEIQHIILTHAFGGLFTMPIHELLSKPGAIILDVGCGPGSWARDVAKMYPKTSVHAVDMAKTLFDGVGTLPNVTFVTANVLEKLPYPDNYFDAVFQRYLTFGIPKNRWDDVLRELNRVTKPGGHIELVEFDVFQNLGPFGNILLGGMYEAFSHRGTDIEFAPQMKNRMQDVIGLSIKSEIIRSFPIGWQGKFGEINLHNNMMAMASIKPMLMKSLEVSSELYDSMVKDMAIEFPIHKTYGNVYSVVGMKLSGVPDEKGSVSTNLKSSGVIMSAKLDEDITLNLKTERHPTKESAKRYFHEIKDSPYVLPADLEKQEQSEIQHTILKYAFGG